MVGEHHGHLRIRVSRFSGDLLQAATAPCQSWPPAAGSQAMVRFALTRPPENPQERERIRCQRDQDTVAR